MKRKTKQTKHAPRRRAVVRFQFGDGSTGEVPRVEVETIAARQLRALAQTYKYNDPRRRELLFSAEQAEKLAQGLAADEAIAEHEQRRRSKGGRSAAQSQKGNKARADSGHALLRKGARQLWDEKPSRSTRNVAILLASRGTAAP